MLYHWIISSTYYYLNTVTYITYSSLCVSHVNVCTCCETTDRRTIPLSVHVHSHIGHTVWGFNSNFTEKNNVSSCRKACRVVMYRDARDDNSSAMSWLNAILFARLLSITVSVCQRFRYVSSNTPAPCTWKPSDSAGCVFFFCLFALKESDLFRLIPRAIWIWLAALQRCARNLKAPSHFSCRGKTEEEPSRFRCLAKLLQVKLLHKSKQMFHSNGLRCRYRGKGKSYIFNRRFPKLQCTGP